MTEKKYAEKDLQKLIEETTRYGAVHALLYFDAHGSDEKAVQASLVDFVSRLTKEAGVLYCTGEVLPPFKRELGGDAATAEAGAGEGYSTSAQVTILCENFDSLLNACLRYAPVGAEILSPKEIRLSLEEAQALLLDASQQAQEYVAFILKRVLRGEELKKFEEQLARRAEIGQSLLDKAEIK